MVLGNPFLVPFHPSLRNYLFGSIRRQIPKGWRGSVSLIGTHGFAKQHLYSLVPSFSLSRLHLLELIIRFFRTHEKGTMATCENRRFDCDPL